MSSKKPKYCLFVPIYVDQYGLYRMLDGEELKTLLDGAMQYVISNGISTELETLAENESGQILGWLAEKLQDDLDRAHKLYQQKLDASELASKKKRLKQEKDMREMEGANYRTETERNPNGNRTETERNPVNTVNPVKPKKIKKTHTGEQSEPPTTVPFPKVGYGAPVPVLKQIFIELLERGLIKKENFDYAIELLGSAEHEGLLPDIVAVNKLVEHIKSVTTMNNFDETIGDVLYNYFFYSEEESK